MRPHLNEQYAFKLPDGNDPILLPFDDNEFDVVFSIGVLEHVRETGGDDILNLKETNRVLKPSGSFICCHLPNKYSLVEFAARHLNARFFHRFLYTNAGIKKICPAAGFIPLYIRRYGFLPRNSWGKLPKKIRNNKTLATIYNWIDYTLSFVLSGFCQNYFVVAKKDTNIS
jgi:ubiquinone/menaquinone biosynthesis C-methylase UbiE